MSIRIVTDSTADIPVEIANKLNIKVAGLATQNNPIKTIKYALEIIAPSDDNPITIHLDEGTYSPSLTGETFSINMISNVNLIGAGEELTILDAEQTDRVITMENCNNNTIFR